MNRLILMALLPVAGLAFSGAADASRYARVAPNKLTVAQRAPLRAVVDVTFPRGTVRNVGDAVNMALRDSGYRLAEPSVDAALLFRLPLPEVHREFRQIELAALLVALGRPGFDLVVDDMNRVVTYQRSARPLVSAHDAVER